MLKKIKAWMRMNREVSGKQIARQLLAIVLLSGLLMEEAQRVDAGVLDNAYDFYHTYGNRIIFSATSDTDGNIYYASRAKKNLSSSIRYSTIGWKATIRNSSGTVLQEVYYKMGGSYLKVVESRTVDDYLYVLHAVSLKDFKSRLNQTALKALEAGNCDIIFDACITLKVNGIERGGMTDEGISWGSVYTTYSGIVNAVQWTTATQESLKSYYGKSVEGLFYTISLYKDAGIASVSGSGKYCYGTTATISATPKSGYKFLQWNGTASSTAQIWKLNVTKSYSLTAYSKQNELTITYYRNFTTTDGISQSQTLYGNTANQFLLKNSWQQTGYYMEGWSHTRTDAAADYTLGQSVSAGWVSIYIPTLNLYGIWKPNQYTICYDNNLPEELSEDVENRTITAKYNESITTLENNCTYEDAVFLGWSLDADAIIPDYVNHYEVPVATLAELAKVENSNGAAITLYAVWNKMPSIEVGDIYVSLQNAQNGKVTEEWLAGFAAAADREDGVIPYGSGEKNSFLLDNFHSEKYKNLQEEICVSEKFCVTDSNGNRREETITIYVVDSRIHSEEEVFGSVRFISEDYYLDAEGNLLPEEKGGLNEKSIWRLEKEYRKLLDLIF